MPDHEIDPCPPGSLWNARVEAVLAAGDRSQAVDENLRRFPVVRHDAVPNLRRGGCEIVEKLRRSVRTVRSDWPVLRTV